MEIPKHVAEYISKHGTNTGNRVLLYLLMHPEPVSTVDIAKAIGVSPKTINKAFKKLKKDGMLQDDGIETQKRRLSIPGASPDAVPEPVQGDIYSLIKTVLDRIESLESSNRVMMDTTRVMMEMIVNQTRTPEIPKPTTYMPEITRDVPQSTPKTDVSAPQADPLNIASSLPFFNKSSQSSSLAADEFKAMFGVPVPAGANMLQVAEMVRRRKSGKLGDVQYPIAYLSKVTIPAETAPVFETRNNVILPAVPMIDMRKVERERQINELWLSLPDAAREPYRQKARQRHPDNGRIRPAIELLARQQFNMEQLSC